MNDKHFSSGRIIKTLCLFTFYSLFPFTLLLCAHWTLTYPWRGSIFLWLDFIEIGIHQNILNEWHYESCWWVNLHKRFVFLNLIITLGMKYLLCASMCQQKLFENVHQIFTPNTVYTSKDYTNWTHYNIICSFGHIASFQLITLGNI